MRAPFVPEFIDVQPGDALYEGSRHSCRDFCRYMLAMKQCMGIGDYAYATILGSVISFLPPNNMLAMVIDKRPTVYKIMQSVASLAELKNTLRTLQFHTCSNRCATFFRGAAFCEKCEESRWIHCDRPLAMKKGSRFVFTA